MNTNRALFKGRACPALKQPSNWARDFDLTEAFKASAVWYYQSLARTLGMAAEDRFVRQLGYGNADTRGGLDGPAGPLSSGVDLSAFRIVQEALTNARRHAPGAAIDVELHYLADELVVRIRDNGPGSTAAADSGGHGLTGMRERAAAFGGELRTGPATGGGFLVEAHLPTACEVGA